MDKKLFANYFYNILYQVVRMLMSVIIVPYAMSTLGATVLGISDFAGNIANWFILFGFLGVNIYGNREIAKVRDNKEELSKTFFEIFVMQFINMTIVSIIYALYIYFTIKENQLIYYLYLFYMAATTFNITWFFYGVENFKSVSIRNTIIKMLSIVVIIIFVKSPDDLWKYVTITALGELLGQVIMFLGLKDYIVFKKVKLRDAYRDHLRGTIALFIPTIASQVYTLLDQTMIGFLTTDTANVATYKAAQSFVRIFLYFITSIGSVMLPRIANIYYKGAKDEVNKSINTTLKFGVLLGLPMMIAMITVAPYFIPWYLPSEPYITILVQISSPIIFFIAISNVFGEQYLVPTGRNNEYTRSVILGAIVNFCVNLLLIPRFAGVGAAIGSVIAEFSVALREYLYVRKDLKLMIDKSYLSYLISSLVMGFVVYMIGRFMGPSFITNVMQAIVGLLVYGIILVILKEELMIKVLNKVRK